MLQIIWGFTRPRFLLWFVRAKRWQKKSVYKYIIRHRPYIRGIMVRGQLAVTRTAEELINEDLEQLYIKHIKQSVGG